jgi:hypothetical protein
MVPCHFAAEPDTIFEQPTLGTTPQFAGLFRRGKNIDYGIPYALTFGDFHDFQSVKRQDCFHAEEFINKSSK